MGIALGLSEQIRLKKSDNIYLEISGGIYYKYYHNNHKNYHSDYKYNNEDWIEYSYNINTYHNYTYYPNGRKALVFNANGWMSSNLKFQLQNNLYFNIGMEIIYGFRFYYDTFNSIKYHLTHIDTETGEITYSTVTENHHGLIAFPKAISLDNFIYTTVGLTYKFGNKDLRKLFSNN
ncbi:MAG: hypothetical protein ACWA41_13285 [Putridiphycobacter sp.]